MKLNFNDILLLVKNKKYNESIEYLDKLIQDDRNNFDYYYLLGISYLNLGKLDNAIESFSHAINIKDDNFIFYHFRGLAYLKLNRLNEAKKDFDKLIELKIDFPEVYNNLGVLLYSLGKNEQAIKNFSKSINLNNKFSQAISGLINALSHTNNIQIDDSEIVSTHNKIKKIYPYYSSLKFIEDKNIKEFFKKTNDIIDNNDKNLKLDMTQIYRRDKNELNCKRHKKVFNTYNAIPQFCFGCYKIQIEPENVIDLIKLYVLFDNIKLENNNLRKCMIEFRPNIPGRYKGLIYCNSIKESENIQNQLIKIIDKNFNKRLSCKIKRGCTEFGMKHPIYNNLKDDIMTYKQEWAKYENLVDEKHPDLTFERKISPTIKGCSLSDILIIRNWLTYARLIGDQSYKTISDQIFHSDFIKKKLKLNTLKR
tara:strand:- start:89 stop:1357 length:1269 start_codon:yes stop_codon:yes gene_type:complete